ncbi:MAG TPA: PH domain-containing protein [Roseiflexaceae bacterium]|nr:PH domain-containing protein [Roseiflexaceae bacterium]
MRRWKPQPSPGRWIALLLMLAALAGAAMLGLGLAQALSGPPEGWQITLDLYWRMVGFVLLLLLAGGLAYRALGAFTLSYELDRNGLYIIWLGNRAIVPLDQIQSVDLGVASARLPWRLIQGIGYYWGQGRTTDGKRLHLFATQPPARCLVINTRDDVYAISPQDHEGFVQDLEQRRNLGATQTLTPSFEPSRMFLYSFWNDATVRGLLLAAFVLNLLLVGVLMARYSALEPVLRMRFDPAGQVTDLRPRHQILFLPLAAFGLTLVNIALGLLVYQRQQLGARLLQGASLIVQILFGIAMLTIIR